jgi:hypothetical protein
MRIQERRGCFHNIRTYDGTVLRTCIYIYARGYIPSSTRQKLKIASGEKRERYLRAGADNAGFLPSNPCKHTLWSRRLKRERELNDHLIRLPFCFYCASHSFHHYSSTQLASIASQHSFVTRLHPLTFAPFLSCYPCLSVATIRS